MTLRIGILTVSDRVSRGEMDDAGGPAVQVALEGLSCEIVQSAIVPDERDKIVRTLHSWSDGGIDVIFTTGGTGLGPRDVTPEATLEAGERAVPGIGEAIRQASLSSTKFAMLSRGVATVRKATLIINLPGSPRGAAEGVQVVLPVLEHAVATLRGGKH